MSGSAEVLFVRHTAVSDKYQSLCYGASDVELSPAGKLHARDVAESLVESPIDRIVHSGLGRARVLAEHLSELTGQSLEERVHFRERDFGSWEMSSWDDIYAEYGGEMLKMITEPDTYRPGGAETTCEFVERIVDACRDLHQPGRTVVVCHGGVIAALSGLIERAGLTRWMDYVPAHGEVCPLDPVTSEHVSFAFRSEEV